MNERILVKYRSGFRSSAVQLHRTVKARRVETRFREIGTNAVAEPTRARIATVVFMVVVVVVVRSHRSIHVRWVRVEFGFMRMIAT
jgi:hypothetical protein